MKTAVGAPAPAPTPEELIDAIGALTLDDLTQLRDGLRRIGYQFGPHACDLPDDHEGDCWYERGSEDD